MENQKGVFNTLVALNCNEHVEKKPTGKDASGKTKELSYLSWPWAWKEVKSRYPDANYSIEKNSDGLPYFYDERVGIMCYTTVTIEGVTHEMELPVMDGSNRAMKFVPQTFNVFNKFTKSYEEKTIAAATMFDVNKTVMRCLVKNLAIFGVGLYIYAGEDLPEQDEDADVSTCDASSENKPIPNTGNKQVDEYLAYLISYLNLKEVPSTAEDITKLWNSYSKLQTIASFKAAIVAAGTYFKQKEQNGKA